MGAPLFGASAVSDDPSLDRIEVDSFPDRSQHPQVPDSQRLRLLGIRCFSLILNKVIQRPYSFLAG